MTGGGPTERAGAAALRILAAADKRPVLLDGGMGSALRAAGLPIEAFPEEWILTRPEAVSAVHAAHAAAGAKILLTCTFNATAPRLAVRGLESALETLCGSAARLARAAARPVLVAGAVGPTGLAQPHAPAPSRRELEDAYARPFRALAAAGADLLWAETQYDLGEALAALAAARGARLPAVVTMTFAAGSAQPLDFGPLRGPMLEGNGGRLGSPRKPMLGENGTGQLATPAGDPAEECLATLAAEGAAAVGVNCNFLDAPLAPLLAHLAARIAVPLVAKPSPGMPGAILPPERFADGVLALWRAGARLLGGCCGATAEHLSALARRLQREAYP